MGKKLNIVFILPGRGRAGGIRVTIIQSNILIERGHNVKIYYHEDSISIRNMYRNLYSHLFHYGSSDWFLGFNGEAKAFKNIRECIFNNEDIIIGVGMWASRQIDKLINLKNHKVQYIHGPSPWDENLMKETLKLHYPKIIVANYLRQTVSEYGGGNILAMIHNGINNKEYYNYKNQKDRDGFGMIYQRQMAKDPETMNKIIELFNKENPEISIRCFGFEGVPKGIRRDNYWRFPSIDTVRKIYNDSAVWIVPSRSEGFSLPILEAMACGCSVIATDFGASREMIDDGKNGFIVKIGDIKGISEKIRLLLNDIDLREEINRNALKTIDNFTWKKNVDELERALSML